MFLSARLKLTAWYVLTVMTVSAAFSLVIYSLLTHELGRLQISQVPRGNQIIETQELLLPTDSGIVTLWRSRIKQALWAVNIALFVVSSSASYVLAGKTLSPIQSAMEEQRRFVSDASHELKTPLAAIKSEIEVAVRDKSLTLNTAKEVLQSNLEEVDNLNRLTTNLLEMNRYKTKGLGFTMENLQLEEVLFESIKKTKVQADKKALRIVNRSNDSVIRGDKQGLVRLFTILLDNAIKYSGEGKEIIIDSKKTRRSVTVDVIDQGMGIDKEDIPHIFDRFYRADKSRSKQKIPGYGLGLTIAKEIVDAHGGELKVKSRPGKGAKFTVVLQSVG